jgi:hypothetical protein
MALRRLSEADRVWNRACFREGNNLREGDVALGALLVVHGYIMNGGVGHAYDLDPDELAAGVGGYKFFGLDDLVAVIKAHGGKDESKYDARYHELAGQDNLIVRRFEEMFRKNPEKFAPLI